MLRHTSKEKIFTMRLVCFAWLAVSVKSTQHMVMKYWLIITCRLSTIKQYSSSFGRSRLSAWGTAIKELLTKALRISMSRQFPLSAFEILNKRIAHKHKCKQSINHKLPTIRWKRRALRSEYQTREVFLQFFVFIIDAKSFQLFFTSRVRLQSEVTYWAFDGSQLLSDIYSRLTISFV